MEFLKAILGDKYTEFETVINSYNALPENKDKQIKIANLGSGEYVDAEKYNRTVLERDNYKLSLDTANKALEGFKDIDVDKLQGEITKLKEDLSKKDTEYQTKISEMEYAKELDRFFSGYKFTSELARKAAMNEFKAKEFKLENGKFLGGEDYMKELMQSNPTAFETEEGEKPPVIVKPTKPHKPGEKMTLMEAMKYKNEHPEVDISTLI